MSLTVSGADFDRLQRLYGELLTAKQYRQDAQATYNAATSAYNELMLAAGQAADTALAQPLQARAEWHRGEAVVAEADMTRYVLATTEKEKEISELLVAIGVRLLRDDALAERVRQLSDNDASLITRLERLDGEMRRLTEQVNAAGGPRPSRENSSSIVVMGGVPQDLSPGELEEQSSKVTDDELDRLPRTINVLLLASQPWGSTMVDLLDEIRQVRWEIDKSAYGERVELQACPAARITDLLDGLSRHRPSAIHISGRGVPEGILLTAPTGRVAPISVEALIQLARFGTDGLSFAFFNVPDSLSFAGAAAQHLPAAIGLDGEMEPGAARVFAGQFYSAIARGFSVRTAFQQARATLNRFPPRVQEVPVLCHRAEIDPHRVILVRPHFRDGEG